VRLYRPVGPKELALIEASGMVAFPPRLPDQPIFYPVLTFEYAEQIARDWNSTREDTGYRGFVTEFEVADAYVGRFRVETAGSTSIHRELWVPAEELAEFNRHIVGKIKIAAHYKNGKRAG
jgi:hypothetical protein